MGILSRQPSCPEATARHTSDIRGRVFVFQQDGAPAHRARDTVSFLERETPDFIPPTLLPPNSPDLNPVDYSIIMECAAGEGLPLQNSQRRRTRNASTRLINEWARFDQSIVDAAIGQWRRRLSACVRVSGAHFEHQF